MKVTRFFSFSLLVILISISFAQSKPMKNKMMNDSSSNNTLDKDRMMRNKEMMNNKLMDDQMITSINKDEDGVAIMGYDPVSYFTDKEATMGLMKYEYNWMGAKWYFANKNHVMMFKESPEKYAPQYGGYCAYGASMGHKASIDPKAFVLNRGKLYLTHNVDVCESLKMNIDKLTMEADKNWKENKVK